MLSASSPNRQSSSNSQYSPRAAARRYAALTALVYSPAYSSTALLTAAQASVFRCARHTYTPRASGRRRASVPCRGRAVPLPPRIFLHSHRLPRQEAFSAPLHLTPKRTVFRRLQPARGVPEFSAPRISQRFFQAHGAVFETLPQFHAGVSLFSPRSSICSSPVSISVPFSKAQRLMLKTLVIWKLSYIRQSAAPIGISPNRTSCSRRISHRSVSKVPAAVRHKEYRSAPRALRRGAGTSPPDRCL